MKNICLAFATMLLFCGCIKQQQPAPTNQLCLSGCMIFNVNVGTETNSAVPVSNAHVQLYWSNPGPAVWIPTNRLIADGTTDANGKITFSIKALADELTGGQFSITVQGTPGYFDQAYVNYYSITRADSVITSNIHLPEVATLNLVFNNFYPTSTNDLFDVNPYINNFGTKNLDLTMHNTGGGTDALYFYGTDKPFIQQTYAGTTGGNEYTYFTITKKKNGIRTDIVDSIYIPKGTSKTYQVSF